MDFAIQTTGLTKRYGVLCAVDNVALRVPRGEIYGFLGLNGAGKTTTIRALLGMIRPSAGTVEVLGERVGPNGKGPWQQVGHLVETPAVYPELTVRENLEITRRLHQVAERDATNRVIEQLGLTRYAERKAGTLSMGNVQRLGLARALLHRPALLILDEPANGLDPAGVVEIRTLLRRLADSEGITIFMSSHILTEVDRLATRIGIIHQGRLIEELDAVQLEQLRARRLEIQSRDLAAAQRALAGANFCTAVDAQQEHITLTELRAVTAPDEVARLLVNAGTPPTRLAVVQENLEEHFLQLTGVSA
ncbi:MAG TPA: ABC transporter ATP-binding protein [Caldilineaceae bacterium]|nr:ABC transporter ATP-binding protein [Caldilineaceae bacterium]